MNTFMIWLANNVNPMWILLIFPLVFGTGLVCVWRDHRKQKKLEADPINMTDTEYHNFNWKRFKK